MQMTTVGSNSNKLDPRFDKLLTNASELIYFGNKTTRNIVESLLSTALDKTFLKQRLASECEKYVGTAHEIRVKKKSVLGKVRYATSRKGLQCLRQGMNIPKFDYTFRVSASKLATAILFLKDSLSVKPGVVRDVTIAGHTFESLPVYERGGKSIESLNEAYSTVYRKEERVDIHLFVDIVKLITKRGEAKVGLSTYYINFRYCSSVFVKIMKRILEFEFSDNEVFKNIRRKVKHLQEEWERIQLFVMWEYANCHLEQRSNDICHCCCYALCGRCGHVHRPHSSATCEN